MSSENLKKVLRSIDGLNDWVGRTASWLILGMVVVTFVIVVLRYFFNLGWVWLQETVIYMHAMVFLLACGTTLLRDAHVRVDIFYRSASFRRKMWVNLCGSLLLLLPTCGLIFYQAFPYVFDSWQVFEGSKDGGGLEGVFILKSMILIFCVLMFLQGVSLLGHSFLGLKEGKDV